MKKSLLSFCFILSSLLNFISWTEAQEQKKKEDGHTGSQSLMIMLPQGGAVIFTVKISQLNAEANSTRREFPKLPVVPQILVDDDNIIHRTFVDENGSFFFGYDLKLELLKNENKFKVSARPLDDQFEARLRARGTNNKRGTQINFPVSTLTRVTDEQIVADGQTFALDLLVNEQLGWKVVDYVKVIADRTQLFNQPTTQAKDFTVSSVELNITNYGLRIDGETVRVTDTQHRSCKGALVWFALPERGRFIFSLETHKGYDFQKVGVISGNKITFTWKGVHYEWSSETPIAPSAGVWNLWVLHDPKYIDQFQQSVSSSDKGLKPSPKSKVERSSQQIEDHVYIGGANNIEALLPQN